MEGNRSYQQLTKAAAQSILAYSPIVRLYFEVGDHRER